MAVFSVRVGDWQVCCNSMADALIDDYIEQIRVIDGKGFLAIGEQKIKFCPFCGKEIKL